MQCPKCNSDNTQSSRYAQTVLPCGAKAESLPLIHPNQSGKIMKEPLVYAKKHHEYFLVFIERLDCLSVQILNNENNGLNLLACYFFDSEEWRGLTWFDDKEQNTGLLKDEFFKFLADATESELRLAVQRYQQHIKFDILPPLKQGDSYC